MDLPPIIQGGMGIAVSGWPLASAVARQGQIGVVSGSGLAAAFTHRLQQGDPGGHLREVCAAFPSQALAQRVLARWYKPAGRPAGEDLELPPLPAWPMNPALLELTVLANFAEIFLAKKHGGSGLIGINLLTKVEILTLPSLYGCMLAGVDAVFMGAGIPRAIPGVLDAFAQGQPATLPLTVDDSGAEALQLDLSELLGTAAPALRRPLFFPIVSTHVLASILLRKSNGRIDGFVVEDHTAGGHNAPPRRSKEISAGGETVWDERDRPAWGEFVKLGLPFYIAGGQDDAHALRAARAQGAHGIQVGTAFAFCEESGIRADLKAQVIRAARNGEIELRSDPLASPTGFPFKVVQLPGTLSEAKAYGERLRNCELGYLRSAYRKADGGVGWRCSAERGTAYVSKGGESQDLAGRRCLCAALAAAAGIGHRDELPILTAGDTLRQLARHLRGSRQTYTAQDVIEQLLSPE